MAIVIPIVTEYADKGLKSAMRDIRQADGVFGKLKASAALAGPAIAAAGIAAGAFAVKLGVEGVQAAAAEERELAKLNTTLRNLGWTKATGDVNAFVDATARATTFDDSAIRQAFSNIAATAPTATAAMEAVSIAVDAAEGSGKNLDTVTQAISKAYGGNVTALGRLFPFLDKAKLKTEGVDYATKVLAERFAGQSAAAADTWEGRLGNVSEAFDELKESFGKGFLDALDAAEGDEAGGGVYGLTEALYDLQTPIEGLGRILGQLVIDLGKVSSAFVTAATAVGNFWKALPIPDGLKESITTFFTSNLFGLLREFGQRVSDAASAWSRFIASLSNPLASMRLPGIPGLSRASGYSAGGPRTFGTTVNVTVQAGVGDPIAIARTIESTLRARNVRLGVA